MGPAAGPGRASPEAGVRTRVPAERQPPVRPLQLLLGGVAPDTQHLVVAPHGAGDAGRAGDGCGERRPAGRTGGAGGGGAGGAIRSPSSEEEEPRRAPRIALPSRAEGVEGVGGCRVKCGRG